MTDADEPTDDRPDAVADDDQDDADADDDAAEVAPDPARRHPAVFASNWRTVLAVDAAMGLLVVIAGVVVAVVWNVVAGGVLGSLGIAYVAAVIRRGRQWAELRRDAGL